jgi:3-oxoacyl-[acyl-carrier-protein] synthase-3
MASTAFSSPGAIPVPSSTNGTARSPRPAGPRQTARSRLASLNGIEIAATGSYVPEMVVDNSDLKARLGFDPEWIYTRTGIRQRRFAAAGQATSDLAVEAARRAIAKAAVDPDEIDLVIVGTFTPDMPFPSTACLVQDRLGLKAPAMDLQAACAGFIYALVTGAQFIAAGTSRLALVIGADTNSRILNPQDQRTYPLFGDGAGAVLVRAGTAEQGLVSYAVGADGSGGDLLLRPCGGSRCPPTTPDVEEAAHYLQMDGRAVFKWAVGVVNETVRDVVREAGLSISDIDLAVFHQANVRIIDAAVDSLGIDPAKVMVNLDRYGNTSAGSIPLALDEAHSAGRIRPGSLLLLSGFGAGLTWGTALVRW